jgi:hypothetical protein
MENFVTGEEVEVTSGVEVNGAYLTVDVSSALGVVGLDAFQLYATTGSVLSARDTSVYLASGDPETTGDLMPHNFFTGSDVTAFYTGTFANATEGTAASAPMNVVLGPSETTQGGFVGTWSAPSDLGSCTFFAWNVVLLSQDNQELFTSTGDFNFFDITSTTIYMDGHPYSEATMTVQVLCIDSSKNSPVVRSNGGAPTLPKPYQTAPPGNIEFTTTATTITVAWTGAPNQGATDATACAFVEWEVELRDPTTGEFFNPEGCTALSDFGQTQCTAINLRPDTDYGRIGVRQVCGDPELTSEWAYNTYDWATPRSEYLITKDGDCSGSCTGDGVSCDDGICGIDVTTCAQVCVPDSCCTPSDFCYNAQVANCVGVFDPYCISVGWDDQCILEAQARCDMTCD